MTKFVALVYALAVGRTPAPTGSRLTIKPQGVERMPKDMPNAGEIIERLARESERQRIEIENLKRENEALKAELLKLQQQS